MCRLFGFRSVILSQVHSSLVDAENALGTQSIDHPDGWGVAYYVANSPHIIKADHSAIDCNIFKKVSGVVSSQTVLAHIRKATLGEKSILNTHPFQFGHWVFAHNGNLKKFSEHRDELIKLVNPDLRRFILGDTDSEILFFIILGHLHEKIGLETVDIDYDLLEQSVKLSVSQVVKIIGEYSKVDDAGDKETYLTFILTNGKEMIAHHGGKNLHYSTYKNKCGERETCPSFSEECESPTKTGKINHLVFTSEPLSGENIWIPLDLGQIIGVDSQMRLRVS